MSFDAHKNLAISEVAVAPTPADSGLTLSVPVGHGTRFATPPFNATVWPKEMPSPVNATIVRVTSIVGDVLTFTRAQEDTANRTILVGDLIVATVTARLLTDIESGLNFPQIVTGAVTGTTGQFTSLGTTPLDATKLSLSAANRLLGRGSSGAGAAQEVTVGEGLVMTGTTLTAPAAKSSTLINFSYNSTLAEPPAAGQVRMDTAFPHTTTTKLWMRFISTDSQDVYWGVMVISPGSSILIQDKDDHTKYVRFTTTAIPIDKGLYAEIPVVWKANGAAIATASAVLAQSTAITTQIHASTHVVGGSDPVTVTALAGYPGGTANFLRADGTFAAPPSGGGSTFPLYGILDDFNRAEPWGVTGQWEGTVHTQFGLGCVNQLVVMSQAPVNATTGAAAYSKPFDINFNVSIEVHTPSVVEAASVHMDMLIDAAGTLTKDGYELKLAYAAGVYTLSLGKYIAGVFTAIQSMPVAVPANTSIGLERSGTTFRAWLKTPAGVWSKAFEVTDVDFQRTLSCLVLIDGADWRLDNFGGGPLHNDGTLSLPLHATSHYPGMPDEILGIVLSDRSTTFTGDNKFTRNVELYESSLPVDRKRWILRNNTGQDVRITSLTDAGTIGTEFCIGHLGGISSFMGGMGGPNNTINIPSQSGIASKLFTIPAGGIVATYLVRAGLGQGSNDAANYGAFAHVIVEGNSARIVANNAPAMQITLVGMDVFATQSSGSAIEIYFTMVRMGN